MDHLVSVIFRYMFKKKKRNNKPSKDYICGAQASKAHFLQDILIAVCCKSHSLAINTLEPLKEYF